MKLASQLDPHGIAASMELRQDIYSTIMEYRPMNIIETGTYNGLGSTSAILHGLEDANIIGFSFISIESDFNNFMQAEKNLNGITDKGTLLLLHAVSVPYHLLPTKIYDVPDDIITDHANPDRYLKEIPKDCKDNGLMTALVLMDYKPDMVLLDSAGHMGTIEFEYLIENVNSSFILILDDTLHRKHYRTLEIIKASPDRFKILKESKNKFGHAIILCK